MKYLFLLFLAFVHTNILVASVSQMVCFYDASSFVREGPAQLSVVELEPALQFCNYLVYGYAGIDPETFQLKSLNSNLDIGRNHYRTITALKRKYSQLRVLLSVGGDKDDGPNEAKFNKYLQLLESNAHRRAFIDSAKDFINTYGFDGLDLAWQFPKNHPKVVKSGIRKAWSAFKGWFSGPKAVDEKAEDHKQQFTTLIRELNSALNPLGKLLTLTVLPNVNAELFIDVFTVTPNLDFVNLATFDFQTPERDPKVADYTAPLYETYERDPTHNVNYHVQYWLNQTAPYNKIMVGVAAYGRAWQMTIDSGLTGYPPVSDMNGSAPVGKHTTTPGLLSWPEICEKLHNRKDLTGDDAPLRKVGDPTKRYGTYAYRSADDNNLHGLWVSYEEPATAAIKAGYVNVKELGGIALFDVSMDDFQGRCAGEKYPILRSIKFKL